MPTDASGGGTTERWDRLYQVLSAQSRRLILFSLMKAPDEEWLPLPDAALSPGEGTNRECLSVQLLHHHLPKLADAGYVRWESEPFRVGRGPRFEEPAFVIREIVNADEPPPGLRDECVVLGGVGENEAN
jgi:hypothetical protein